MSKSRAWGTRNDTDEWLENIPRRFPRRPCVRARRFAVRRSSPPIRTVQTSLTSNRIGRRTQSQERESIINERLEIVSLDQQNSAKSVYQGLEHERAKRLTNDITDIPRDEPRPTRHRTPCLQRSKE